MKKKLDSYDVIVSERNDLQELCNEFQKWRENNKKEQSKMFTDLLSTFDIQSEKLKQVTAEEMKWKSKYCELQQINDSITDRLDVLKLNERNLKSKLSEVEKEKECIQKELCCVQVNNFFIFKDKPLFQSYYGQIYFETVAKLKICFELNR